MRPLSRMRVLAVASLTLVLAATVATPATAGAVPMGSQRVSHTVDRLATHPALGSTLGVHALDVVSGEGLVDISARTGFIPASTMKVITAYTALRSLGSQHRFTTEVVRSPNGRLVLIGGGDPVLTSQDLGLLAKRTARALSRGVAVPIVVVDFDDAIFGAPRNAPGWESGDMPVYVSAVRGLGLLGSYSTDTGRVVAQEFVGHLRALGIPASVGTRINSPSGSDRLARFRGNTVADAVDIMMPVSENNVAEILFRHVAISMGQPANWVGARRAARTVLSRDGFHHAGSAFIDGSGLSYGNRLTPQLLTRVLARVDTDPRFAAARDSLPMAGVNGTLIRRFSSSPASCARGVVVAKTGSLPMTVSTLAGLTTTTSGERRAFAVMVNNRPSTAAWSATSLAIDSIAAAVNGCVR